MKRGGRARGPGLSSGTAFSIPLEESSRPPGILADRTGAHPCTGSYLERNAHILSDPPSKSKRRGIPQTTLIQDTELLLIV